MHGMQMIVILGVCGLCKAASRQNRLAVDRLHTRQIERHGVKRCEHAHIRHHRHIVLRMAVAVRGNIAHDGDMEAGTSVYHRLGILSDLVVENLGNLVAVRRDGVLRTDGDAPAAAEALVVVDGALLIRDDRCAVGADLCAPAAADAFACNHMGLALCVHFHLARARAAAHADVLERAAVARLLMPLEVR